VYSLTGPAAVDLSQVAAIVGAQTGRPLRFKAASEADYSRRLEAVGIPKSAIDLSISFFRRLSAGAFAEVLPTVATLLGRSATSYAEWAKANAARLIPQR